MLRESRTGRAAISFWMASIFFESIGRAAPRSWASTERITASARAVPVPLLVFRFLLTQLSTLDHIPAGQSPTANNQQPTPLPVSKSVQRFSWQRNVARPEP